MTYLFIRINGHGIGKGGIRADAEHVSFSGEGALSTNMLFKTLGLGIPLYTIGKGGILGDLLLKGVPSPDRERIRSGGPGGLCRLSCITGPASAPSPMYPPGTSGSGGGDRYHVQAHYR